LVFSTSYRFAQTCAIHCVAFILGRKGEKKFAIEDFKKGAELGDENGRINLKKFYNIDYPVSKVSKK
jgi:hypothetical protein